MPHPVTENDLGRLKFATFPDGDQNWVHETSYCGAEFRWIATQDKFESRLYRLPIWNLHLEVESADSKVLTPHLDNRILQEFVSEQANRLFHLPAWGRRYLFAKLVENEPLHTALCQIGFREVERRRLYRCKVRNIAARGPSFAEDSIRFTSLAEIPPEQHSCYHQQILKICREAFEGKGHSRHFIDPVLRERLPGVAYMLAIMNLNFEHIAPDHFLVAIDSCSDYVCGFSVVGKKIGFKEDVYTQLLSAVRKTYRSQGIYRRLTHILSQVLPLNATLLNVTHINNYDIQRAYQGSGRVHLADTVVLRRVFA